MSFSLCSSLFAQQLIYDHFGIREGLSSRVVSDIIYDHQNLIWVSTANGLNRFDGYQFVNFSSNQNRTDQQQLSQAQIKDLALAKDGRIIIIYQDLYSSFDIIDPVTFEVEKIEVSLVVEGEPRSLFANRSGDIYVVSKTAKSTSISLFDYEENTFNQVSKITELWERLHPNLNFISINSNQFILYDQEMGLRLIKVDKNEVVYIPSPDSDFNSKNTAPSLSFLHQARDGIIWLAYQNRPGIYTLNETEVNIKPNHLLPNSYTYTNLWEDDFGNIIFNQAKNLGNYPSSQQLLCLDREKNILNFSHLLGVGQYILSISSNDFLQSIFIGTDTGLKIVQNSTTQVQQYLSQNITEENRAYSMRGMCTDHKGNVYFSREIKSWYHLDLETNLLDTIYLYDDDYEIIDFTRGQGIIYDSTGFIWGPTGDGTASNIGLLHCYDIENCTNETYYYENSFSSYASGNDGQIWLGARRKDDSGSLVSFNKATKIFNQFIDEDDQNPFSNTLIRYILPDKKGILWLGTEKGLFWVNTLTKKWKHYLKGSQSLFPKAERVNLSDNIIYSLFKDSQGILWIGTLNGLNSLNPETNKWETFYKEDGLASNTIADILPGKNNSMWISTYNGLSYFTQNKEQSRRFFSINGLSHNEFNRFSALIDENGQYYFGGVNGVNAFKPEELLKSPDIPKVLMTSFSYFDSKADSTIVQYSNLSNIDHDITIEPHIRFFSFDFSLPFYTPTTINQFRYKIHSDAAEPKWIYLKKDRSLRFNNLKAGNYTIEVQGADSSGTWSKDPLLINLVVKEFFYRTWWFLFIGTLVILSIGYILLRYRLEEKLRMERLRTQLASDLHDEVSGLLAGISLQSELLRSQVNEENISIKLQNIRQASQRAMSKISDVIWSIDSRRDRIEDLITRMEEHADEVLLPLNIRYKITTKELDSSTAIPANIRQDVYFIYKEAINNVAKHSSADFVIVNMENEGHQFEMMVKDNGQPKKTIPEVNGHRKRKGQGLSNLRMRAQRLKAQLNIMIEPNYTIRLRMKRFS